MSAAVVLIEPSGGIRSNVNGTVAGAPSSVL
jgi:hypothetical protein